MAYPNNPYPASYKIYDSSANAGQGAWIEYYFRTSADLVGETGPYNGDASYARKFITNTVYVNGVAFAFSSLPTAGATAEVTITGLNIANGVATNGTYVTAGETIAASLGALDYAIANVGSTLTDFVPYTGATTNVNLNKNGLYFGESGIVPVDVASYGPQMQFLNTTGQYRFFGNDTETKKGILKFSELTANQERTYTFPDASGTVALQGWVGDNYVPYSNATSNVDLGNHSLTANGLAIKHQGSVSCGGFGTSANGDLTLEGAANIFLAPVTKLYYGDSTGTNDANEIVKKSDLTSYVPTTRTVNGKPLSSNISLTSNDIGYSGPNGDQQLAVKQGIDLAISTAKGNAQSYVIDTDGAPSGNSYANHLFNDTTHDELTIVENDGNAVNTDLYLVDGTSLYLPDLKVGDTIFITDPNVPDRWLGSKEGEDGSFTYVFYKLETYNMQWDAISNKPTTIAGYGITDASINTTTKVITLGTSNNSPVTISPVTGIKVGSSGSELSPTNGVVTLPAYPDTSGLVPYSGANDNVNLGEFALTAEEVGAYYNNYHAVLTVDGINIGYQSNNGILAFPSISDDETKTIATTDDLSSYIPLAGTTSLSGDIVPTTTSVKLGSSSKYFNKIYAYTIENSGNLYLQSSGASTFISGSSIYLKTGSGSSWAILSTSSLTDNRSYSLPNAGGTIGLAPHVGTTAPSSYTTGSVWIDTSNS